MSVADIVILAIVAIVFVLCVRSFIKGQQKGECSDCSAGGSCNASKTGHCNDAQHLVAQASAAAKAYEAKK